MTTNRQGSQEKAAKKTTITVRTSITPDVDLEVTEAEHQDLEAQGLLVKSEKKGARLRQERAEEE